MIGLVGFAAHWEIQDIRFRGLSIMRRDNEAAGRGEGRRGGRPGNLSILLETRLAMSPRSRGSPPRPRLRPLR